ncbi:recombinase family protein [Microbacterium sp. NPDC056234]|uniref:recombinase family protein n=1 Tax=Microbacterium sp. NPDC056234 TaxID=3345757 RepID=UPI0035D8C24B
METVDLYTRLSIFDHTTDGMERQEKDLRAWAESEGMTVRKVWRDPGVSAYKNKARKDFEQALVALKAKEVATLLVWKLDRLSRRGAGHIGTILDDLEKVGGRIRFLKDGLDTAQENHRLSLILFSEQARGESKNTALRINSKNQALREAGLPILGKRRFGYLDADKSVGRVVNTVEHPEEAEVVRMLFARYIGGESVNALANELGWRNARVRETLANPAYMGILKSGDTTYPAAEHVARLVDEDTFTTVQARLTSQSAIYRGFNHQGGQVKHVASGIALCGVCGAKVMFRNTYVCQKVPTRHISIKEATFDKLIMTQAVETLLDPDFSVDIEPGSRSATPINADLVQTEADIQDVLSGLSNGLKMAQLLPHLKPLQERQTALQAELEAYSAGSVQARVLNDIASSMRSAAEVWSAKPPGARTQRMLASLAYADLPLSAKRELIEGLFSIVIHPGRGTDRVKITLKRQIA